MPASGVFVPEVLSGGTVRVTAGGTTIDLGGGGYFELRGGTRYTCASASGCTVENGAVTVGVVDTRAPGAGGVCQVGILLRPGESCA